MSIHHASQTHLEALNRQQRSFINELGLTDEQAFLMYKLAPLELRRDIAALGLLHKIQLGEAHADFDWAFPDFDGLFPKAIESGPTHTRHGARRHGRQFKAISGNSSYFNQFLFGMTKVYDVLPEYAVSSPTVASFQFAPTKDARFACQSDKRDWISTFHNRNHCRR